MTVRGRLTLWYGGALLLMVGSFSSVSFLLVRANLLGQVRHEVDEAYEAVEAACRHDPAEVYELEKHGRLALFEAWDGDRLIHRTAQWDAIDHNNESRIYEVKSGRSGAFRISVAYDSTSVRSAVRTLGLVFLIGIPIAGGAALAGGYLLAGRLLSPVGGMAERARVITAERLSERLPVANPADEFGRLATVINETLERLQDSFGRLRRFTADASHELRTPLTALRSVGEVALQQGQDAAFYRDVIGSMLEEVDRLSRLVDSLLFLTRADAGAIQPVREKVILRDFVRETVELLRVLAEEKHQTLHVDAEDGVAVRADAGLLRQGLMNLIDNAIKYTPSQGQIRVKVHRSSDGKALIEVNDTGPGIPGDARERLFERFYRPDPGRSRDEGGAGLGLSIARWAVEANEGRLEFRPRKEAGSSFVIVLPAV